MSDAPANRHSSRNDRVRNDRARTGRAKTSRPLAPSPPPTTAVLHEWALSYLTKSAATAAGMTRVLERRVAAWARRAAMRSDDGDAIEAQASHAKTAIGPVVARLCEVGLIDDAAFVERRARGLALSGKSRRAIVTHLAQKGASESLVASIVPRSDEDELGAALAFARKRRIGPFAREAEDERARQKALAAMARAGFDFRTCRRALTMDREDAEERLSQHRRGEF